MERILLRQGYADIARDVRRLIEYILTAENRISVLACNLNDVFHAVEWWLSADYGDDTLRKHLEEYRKSNAIRPITQERLWQAILDNLQTGLYGDPTKPEVLLRYWEEMAAAGYPSARENVQYFTGLTENLRHPAEREARWKGAGMGDYYCSLCQHTISGRTKFCPECGAKMDEWEETDE